MGDESGNRYGTRSGNDRVDALFAALADEHRRQVLQYFRTRQEDVASVDEIVTFADEVESRLDRRQLSLLFHHSTLPKLAEYGYVEYDPRTKTVRYRGSAVLERVLSVAEEWRLQQA